MQTNNYIVYVYVIKVTASIASLHESAVVNFNYYSEIIKIV